MTPTQGEHAQTALAHELFAAAQLAPGEGIEDAVSRIAAALTEATAQPAAPQGVAYAELADASTKGEWFVRKLEKDGELKDCFVAAPDCTGCAYDAEILGDDEYRGDMVRKLADCELIVNAVKHYRASNGQAPAGATEREFKQFLSDVMTAAGLVTRGNKCKALGDRLAEMCMRLRCPTAQAAPAAGAVAGLADVAALRVRAVQACANANGRDWEFMYSGHQDEQVGAWLDGYSAGQAAAPTQPDQSADSVLEDAALLHYALADGGNQSMNWQDVYDDWNGEGCFIDALRAAYKQDAARKQGAKHD